MCTIRPRTVAHVNQYFTNLMKLVAYMPLSQVFKNSGMQYAECRLHTAHSIFFCHNFCNFLVYNFATNCFVTMQNECNIPTFRLGKMGSLGPQRRVCCSKLSFFPNHPPMRVSFWQKEDLLQQAMTLLLGLKDTFLPTLTYIPFSRNDHAGSPLSLSNNTQFAQDDL